MESIFRSAYEMDRPIGMKKKLLFGIGILFLFLAIGAEFIANDDPILYTYKGEWKCGTCAEWPGRQQHQTPKESEAIIQPLFRFDAQTLSQESKYLSTPLSSEGSGTHWLGTDSQSRDVLAGIIYGTRYALLIGIISVFFAMLSGIISGGLAAYYSDNRLRIPYFVWAPFLILSMAIIYLIYYAVVPAIWGAILMALLFGLFFFSAKSTSGTRIPINQFVTKTIELFDSLPALFVLLAWSATVQTWNIWTLSLLIAFFRWPTFARLVRSEMTPWAHSPWIMSLRGLKMSDFWIIRTQLVNLIIIPISVHAAFAVAGSVSIEATLTFLGFGLGVETQSWGRLLSDARQYFQAWWLVVFPGLFLFLFLWWTNAIAQYIQAQAKKTSP